MDKDNTDIVSDGGEDSNYSKVAGGEPSRNGTRRIVTPDEATTPYYDDTTFHDSLVGIDMEIGTSFNDNSISYVNIKPQVPKRGGRAATNEWLMRLAVRESDALERPKLGVNASEPLDGYQPETTEDYRQADPEDPRGSGGYERDHLESPLTEQIADIVTRNGGRIPVNFSATVQNEGYARSRDWTVYAPGQNPYHVAAAVMDLLQDADGVSNVNVHVAEKTGAEMAQHLRATRFAYEFNTDEDDLVEYGIRMLRWEHGLPASQRRALKAIPSEARERIQTARQHGKLGDKIYNTNLKRAGQHPGDAWDYYEVEIHIDEEADNPDFV